MVSVFFPWSAALAHTFVRPDQHTPMGFGIRFKTQRSSAQTPRPPSERNLSTVTDPSGTATYTWYARNQLTEISATRFSTSFTYDSFGRRTGKTVQGVTTNFVYDGLNPVQEKAGATVMGNLVTGLGIDEFLTRTDGVGSRALLPDALGSTVAMGDSTGTLQTQYTYEPFGYETQTGQASTNSYKYTGREEDGSGLDYYRARYYHPRLQRFIAEDPIGFAAGTNFYAYVKNNPVSLVDPRGLWGGGGQISSGASAGVGPAGAAVSSTAGWGIFWGGKCGINGGGFESSGAFAGGPGYGLSYPSDNSQNIAMGAFTGAGIGGFFTNATSANDLTKTEYTASVDYGVGPLAFGWQYSYGNGIFSISLNGGWGVGLGRTMMSSNTTAGLEIGAGKCKCFQ